MELSARTPGSAHGVDLAVDRALDLAAEELHPFGDDALGSSTAGSGFPETVVVHVQLRPRRSATRRCLAALAALAARHEAVPFSLTGISGDDRVVRVTVGVELGPRDLIAKFSDQAQAAYAFVDGLFTDLYDFMPVYVGEPGEAECAAAAGVLEAAETPRPRTPSPRIPAPRTPLELGSAGPSARYALSVPA